MADIDPRIPVDTAQDTAAVAGSAGQTRKRAFLLFGGAVALVAVGVGGYEWLYGGRYVETDNAYVNAEVAQVTPQVGGPVLRVNVGNTQVVHKGDVLVELDQTDARIALAAAEAGYQQAIRRVRQTVATGSSLADEVGARQADIARMAAQVTIAQAELARARVDLDRREALATGGGVSGEELTSARSAFASAQGSLAAARAGLAQAQAVRGAASGQQAANAALVSGVSVENNPDVLAARAKLDQARIDLGRTVVRAPVDGVVTQRTVQVGQRVAPGALMLTVVPIGAAYVDANFKESQLRHVQPGQPVTLTSDLYGGDVVYHGRVVGFSGGTGSALAVIPAQNATGNWIKVVQRLPVRVTLDPKELAAHPLRIGLSMTASVDTRSN
ncbi:HlyD family efflux transporter periplasmic adaptor subunit [Novosphingobium sp. FKTRR1]|uniref:HlyD family efflux transporter periplasmic adaptor subunit n=1 Tax=Novosphingobium sp. FKTRR1 TaxID=2879118 RepID=UPI001CF02F02|nr:HlyD family efflux transporter periplasmic adaptor subunit [Novosphingobium sp. FKTRR1]